MCNNKSTFFLGHFLEQNKQKILSSKKVVVTQCKQNPLCHCKSTLSLSSHANKPSFPWFPHNHHVVSRSTPHGFKCGHHMFFKWTPCSFHVYTKWFPYGHNMTFWFPHDFHRWKCHFHGEIPQDGNNIISTSFLWVETRLFPGRNHMVSMCYLNCSLNLA